MSSEAITRNDLENILNEIMSVQKESDYVVDYGTSGIWTYRKWDSGIAECWGRTDTVVPTSGYYAEALPTGVFESVTQCSVNAWYGTSSNRNATKYILTDGSYVNGTNRYAVAYVRDYAGNAVNPYIAFDWYVHGTWK